MAIPHDTLSSIIYTFNFLIWARMASLLQKFLSPSEKIQGHRSLENYYVSSVQYPDPVIHWNQAVYVFPQGAEKSVWVSEEEGGEQGKGAVEPRRTEPTFQ